MADQSPSSNASTEESATEAKPWFKRWWGIALIVLGALVVVQALAGGDDDEQAERQAVMETADADDEAAEAADEAAEEAVEVEVPDVAGEALPDARSALRDLDLDTDEVDVDDDRLVIGTRSWEVESQSPEPGTTVEAGDTVTLNVFRPRARELAADEEAESEGAADQAPESEDAGDESAEEQVVEVEVPDVSGEPLPDARSALADAGLEIDQVDIDEGRNVFRPDNWEVESQSPEPGTTLETGDTVTLNVFRPQDREDEPMPVEAVIERVDCVEVEYYEPESNTADCVLEGPGARLVIVRTFASERAQERWADDVEEDGTFMVEFSACELWAMAVQDGDYETELDFLEQADTEC